ncbi:mannitol dehydrogenase family protein [Actinophytocola sediminis]
MTRLSLASAGRGADRPGLGIVHLGLGAFHRAHQAVLTGRAVAAEPGDWAICAVSQRNPAVTEALTAQDGLFTVTERAAGHQRIEIVDSIREALHAPALPDRLTALLSEVDIVTITVTEAGYRHDPATGRLLTGDRELAADLAGRPPRTVIGQLVAGLRARTAPGPTVLSCDNLPFNGRLVAGLVREFCQLRGEFDLADRIAATVRFPSTVVDQIVPATTAWDRAVVATELGFDDRAAVVGEPYRRWVIEDDFAGPRPAWERAGAELVADIAPQQAAKLRLLNGTHSALAYLGLLAGCTSMAQTIAQEEFAGYAARLVREETGPSLARFGITVTESELDTLLDRLANPEITHLLTQIAADGERKLPQRLLEPAAELLAAGRPPRLICLALAGFHRCRGLSTVDFSPPELAADPVFAELLADAGRRLDRDGVRVTLRRLVDEGS